MLSNLISILKSWELQFWNEQLVRMHKLNSLNYDRIKKKIELEKKGKQRGTLWSNKYMDWEVELIMM